MSLLSEDEIGRLRIPPEYKTALRYLCLMYPHRELLNRELEEDFTMENTCAEGVHFFTGFCIAASEIPCFEGYTWSQSRSCVNIKGKDFTVSARKFCIRVDKKRSNTSYNEYVGSKFWILVVCSDIGDELYFYWCEKNPWVKAKTEFQSEEMSDIEISDIDFLDGEADLENLMEDMELIKDYHNGLISLAMSIGSYYSGLKPSEMIGYLS